MTVFTKLRREIEPKWVSEYVAKFYPDFPVRFRVPLGAVPKELEKEHGLWKAIRTWRPWRPEVDAIVIRPGELTLIEGKIFKTMDGLSKLPVYASLVPETPELESYRSYKVAMQLLCVHALDWIKQAAKKSGIEVVEWAPTWVEEIWLERDKYWTPEAVSLRERRKEVLRRLGFE